MGQFVQPKVYLVGYTGSNMEGVKSYLKDTNQEEFLEDIKTAQTEGISDGEILTSLAAKMCYKSIVIGKNSNISKVRSIKKNLEATYDSAHGSVFEHFGLNFIVTDCSRVFTHELVRHRAGTAFSQTSGRYCRLDKIDLVWDPILDPVKEMFTRCMSNIEMTVYLAECKLGLRKPPPEWEKFIIPGSGEYMGDNLLAMNGWPVNAYMWIENTEFDFEKKKKLTSAIRRITPNGQSNEIAFSCNVRALRHMIQVRTARHAEYEIRHVFNQVYHLVREKFPLMFYKARTKSYDGLLEVHGMKLQPYEIEVGDPKALEAWSDTDLFRELHNRGHKLGNEE